MWYTLSNDTEASRAELASVHGDRHVVEEVLQQGKQEVGLSHDEVRSWTGWHHHITLTLLALWFLQLEKMHLKKTPAVTVAQVRAVFTALLQNPSATPAEIAAAITQMLQRNEQARVYHWHRTTGEFPPRKRKPGPCPKPPK